MNNIPHPTVSVVVPNYNHAQYLRERIESILRQTFTDFEVIILDDCSTDGSQNVIKEFRKDGRIAKIVYNSQNSGNTFKQWAKGLELAQGDLVWIAESDDFAEATFLEELVPPMVKDKDITLGFCQSVLFNDGEEITRVANSKKLKSVYRGRDFICKRLFGGNGIPNASMAIFRRSAAASISLDEIAMRYCGDWYFWVVLCQKGKILESGRYLNYFRRHEGNVSGGATKDGLDFLEGDEVFKLVLDTCSPSPEEIAAARECRRAYYYICRNQYDKSTDLKVKESLRRIGINKVGSPSILVRNIKDILRRSAAKFQNSLAPEDS